MWSHQQAEICMYLEQRASGSPSSAAAAGSSTSTSPLQGIFEQKVGQEIFRACLTRVGLQFVHGGLPLEMCHTVHCAAANKKKKQFHGPLLHTSEL